MHTRRMGDVTPLPLLPRKQILCKSVEAWLLTVNRWWFIANKFWICCYVARAGEGALKQRFECRKRVSNEGKKSRIVENDTFSKLSLSWQERPIWMNNVSNESSEHYHFSRYKFIVVWFYLHTEKCNFLKVLIFLFLGLLTSSDHSWKWTIAYLKSLKISFRLMHSSLLCNFAERHWNRLK